MAQDIITRFKLETTAFDSAIKKASKELSDYSKTATQAKEGFNQFTKSNVDAARALGTMATTSTNVKGKLQELVGAYNEGVKAYKALSDEHKKSDWAKALAESLTTLQGRIKETKDELYGLGDAMKKTNSGGGLFGSGKLDGMLQVLGGNLMTKLASAGMSFASEIGDAIQASSQLAREAEGVRIAFDRLDDPTLLDALKEATHGTVSEFELMKAAVKFKDFKLPLEELGSMLAFAQQKAKDTGQSVDYMVNSIVTGLGRKSKLILDNLGISAAEIDEKMKATGDMTKAVGQIIREQMASAGSYVETAADRSARATAELQNKMLELGRTFQPIQEAGVSMFNSMKMAAIDALNGMRPFFDMFTEAGRIRQQREGQGGDSKVNQQLSKLKVARAAGSSYYVRSSYNSTVKDYQKQISDLDFKIAAFGKPKDSIDKGALQRLKERREAVNQLFNEYKEGAKQYLNPSSGKSDGTTTPTTPVKIPKGSHTETPQEKAAKRMADAQHKYELSLEKAKAELDEGTITEAEFKKVQKRAAESLFEAADDAYQTFADPQYKAVKDDAKQKFVALGGEIKTLTETEKANQKTAREQEQAQKKLSDALRKQADALERGNLKDYNAATKQVREAEKEVARLGGSAAFENVEHGDINIPVGLKVDDSALKSFTEQVDQKLGTSPIPFQFALNQENVAAVIENLKEQLSRADVGSELFNSLLEKLGNAQLISDSINKGISDNIDGKTGKKRKKDGDSPMDKASKALGGLNSIAGGLEKMGVELPSEVQNLIGVIEGAMAIIQGVQAIIAITQTTALTANTVALGALTAAMWANVTTGFIPFLKTGGVAHAAQGFVPGNNYSDNVPLMVSSGELILNRAQQGNLASQLEGGAGLGDLNLSAVIRGEQIRLVLNNNGRRTGRGEYVQSKSVK